MPSTFYLHRERNPASLLLRRGERATRFVFRANFADLLGFLRILVGLARNESGIGLID